MKKGFVFTLDAAIGLFLILMILSSVIYLTRTDTSGTEIYYHQSHFIAEDGMEVLNKLGALDAAGKAWAEGNISEAEQIIRGNLSEIMPTVAGYEFWIDDDLIVNETGKGEFVTITASRVLSGYGKLKPVLGYMARTWAIGITKWTSKVVSISPGGSGFRDAIICFEPPCKTTCCEVDLKKNQRGPLTIRKTFEIPTDATNISAILYISVHEVGGNVIIRVNEGEVSMYVDSAYFGSEDVSSYVHPGNNTLEIYLEEPLDYNAHIHPGMRLEIAYRTETFEIEEEAKRKSFPEVIGNPGAWYVLPYTIPENATLNLTHLHIEGQDVDDYVTIWVNNNSVYEDEDPPTNPVIDLDITDYMEIGKTNVIAVYMDMGALADAPTKGARGECRILNTSYVEAEYFAPSYIPYRAVDIVNVSNFGGDDKLVKRYNFSIPGDVELIRPAYVHIAQKYSCRVAAWVWHGNETEPHSGPEDDYAWVDELAQDYMIFLSPTLRAVPTDIYIPLNRLEGGSINWVKVRDGLKWEENGGTKRCSLICTILPNSSVEYRLAVPAYVGYGDVFMTDAEAIADAQQRLNDLLVGYGINATEVSSDTVSISRIPSLWGPAKMTLRVRM